MAILKRNALDSCDPCSERSGRNFSLRVYFCDHGALLQSMNQQPSIANAQAEDKADDTQCNYRPHRNVFHCGLHRQIKSPISEWVVGHGLSPLNFCEVKEIYDLFVEIHKLGL